MSPRRGILRAGAFLSLVALAASACSDDPSGEGFVTVTVEAAVPLGAAVLDLRGGRVTDVEPLPTGWAVLETLPAEGSQEAHRLLVVQEQTGMLSVRLKVSDLEAPLPTATVIQASGADDRPLTALGGVQARVRR